MPWDTVWSLENLYHENSIDIHSPGPGLPLGDDW
jgi:hypothetical protein